MIARFAKNEYSRRMDLCLAYMMGGYRQLHLAKANGMKSYGKDMGILSLAKAACEEFMQEYEDATPEGLNTAFHEMLNSKQVKRSPLHKKKSSPYKPNFE